jgi:DNA-binding NtrC family response regulator
VRITVAGKTDEVRILAVITAETELQIKSHLNSFGMHAVLVTRANQLRHIVRSGVVFHVILLPAAVPEMDWWTIWGELASLTPRPAILVYAPSASFSLWSDVLDAGGYDVIVQPFTDEKLRDAVLRAAESFALRASESTDPE